MDCITIKSATTDAALEFSERKGDYFTVTLRSSPLIATKVVWGYTDCELLVDLFRSMAADWRGWSGRRDWQSIEGEFSISCTADRLGHVSIATKFQEFQHSECWTVEYILRVEAGQLDAIAHEVATFFGAAR